MSIVMIDFEAAAPQHRRGQPPTDFDTDVSTSTTLDMLQ